MPTAVVDPRLQELRSANEILFDRAVRHSIYLERLKTGTVNGIISLLDRDLLPDLLDRIGSRLNRIRSRGFETSLSSLKGLQDLATSIDAMIRAGANLVHGRLRTELREIALTEAQWQTARMRDASSITLDIVTPSPATLRSIIEARPFQGRLLRDHWSTWSLAQQQAVKRQINIGLASGEATQTIVNRLSGPTGVLQISRRQAEVVVRTAVTHTTTHARETTYRENEDVISGVQWVSTLDTRTTDICISYDGKVFNIGEGIRPPAHMNCRSTTIPVLKSWKELGIDLKEAPEGTRASMNGQVPARMTYGEWLRQQPREIQDQVLGRGRAELFRRGKVPIDRFVDRKGRSLTLDELRKLEGLPARRGASSQRPQPRPPSIPRASQSIKDYLSWRADVGQGFVDRIQDIGSELREASRELVSRLDDAKAIREQRLSEFAGSRRTKAFQSYARSVDQALTSEMDALRSRISQLTVELERAHEAKQAAFFERWQMPVSARKSAFRVGTIKEDQGVVITPAIERRIKKAVELINSLAGGNGGEVDFVVRSNVRCYFHQAAGRRTIVISGNESLKVILHELGHAWESFNADGLRRSRAFLLDRSNGLSTQRLSEITGKGYASNEKAWKDEFWNPYIGKDYGDRATEITSMLLEQLLDDPDFALRSDRSLVEFVLDNLRGNL